MTAEIKLEAQTREAGTVKAKRSSKEGFILANIYSGGKDSKNLKVKKVDFQRVFAVAGESNLIDLVIDGKESEKVIVKEIQKDPVKDSVLHVDFYKVDMKQKITTEIPLNFVGEAKAVKELGATLAKNMDKVEVECLPGDLVNNIDVDISVLKNIHDAIRLNDLVLPAGMTLVGTTNDVVASAIETKKEVEQPVVAPTEEAPKADAKAGDKEKVEEKKEEKK